MNLRHLPWPLDGISACGICSAQFGRRQLLERHRELEHPEATAAQIRPTVNEWWRSMTRVYEGLAGALGLPSAPSIVDYVREHGLALQGPYSVHPEEVWLHGEGRQSSFYSPHDPAAIHDCAHWKVATRLIAIAGTEWVGPADGVRTLEGWVEQGWVYVTHDVPLRAARSVGRAARAAPPTTTTFASPHDVAVVPPPRTGLPELDSSGSGMVWAPPPRAPAPPPVARRSRGRRSRAPRQRAGPPTEPVQTLPIPRGRGRGRRGRGRRGPRSTPYTCPTMTPSSSFPPLPAYPPSAAAWPAPPPVGLPGPHADIFYMQQYMLCWALGTIQTLHQQMGGGPGPR